MKDREHLREKLQRKVAACAAKGIPFPVTPENLLTSINDLAGVRILHLHTRQIQQIDPLLREIFAEQKYELLEGAGLSVFLCKWLCWSCGVVFTVWW